MNRMRKALCVGIDYYSFANNLFGCVNDAFNVTNTLERNEDDTLNFHTKLIYSKDRNNIITSSDLRHSVEELFDGESDVALFYYAGHGAFDEYGGYLCPSDIKEPADGYALEDLLKVVAKSKSKNKIIILDSCHSGYAGTTNFVRNCSVISNDTIILAACDEKQYASEQDGHGLFTSLLIEALKGGAMNLLGEVSPGSIYSYIDRSLGPWEQRPLFKANIKSFISLRKNIPPISIKELRKLDELFCSPTDLFKLDQTYEPDKHECSNKEINKEHEEIFKLLQRLVQLNIVTPVGEPHMYYAAIHNKACGLTAQGKHYWQLVHNKTI